MSPLGGPDTGGDYGGPPWKGSNGHTESEAETAIQDTRHPLVRRAQYVRPVHEARSTDEERAAMRRDLAYRVITGQVPIGPITKHEPVLKHRGDPRDPQALGEALISIRESQTYDAATLREAADTLAQFGYQVGNYEGDFTDHSKLRRKELERRAAAGDKFAAALLRGDTLAEEPVD